jgi:hypothetical protein
LEVESIAVHEEFPKEEATVETFGALKKRHRDRHLAVRGCGQPKERTQGNGGSQKKLIATCRGITHHAIPAWRKGQGQESVARGTPKGQMFKRRQWRHSRKAAVE